MNILIVPQYLLGLYYNTNNDFFQAGSLFEQAVALGKKFPGNYNFYIGSSFNELSFIYYLIGDYQRALEKAVSGLEIAEKFGDISYNQGYYWKRAEISRK